MSSLQSSAIRSLLRTGRVRWSDSVKPDTDAVWALEELRGRVVELTGEGASALTTVAVGLVLEAQCAAEPVAWITHRGVAFYPPDVAVYGVDLSAVAVVLLDDALAMLRAADQLLRSGAFGLVVVDFAEAVSIPLAAQTRFVGLTKQHDAALVVLAHDGVSALGSFASMRAVCERRRVDDGLFECSVRVVKDKRRGRVWQHARVCDGTLGLR